MNGLCQCEEGLEKNIQHLKLLLPKEDVIIDLAELFKVFGDSTRMKILCVLMERELCVCDLAQVIGSSVSATSHQLRILKQAKLVRFQKKGKGVFYSLADEHVREIYRKGLEHVEEV